MTKIEVGDVFRGLLFVGLVGLYMNLVFTRCIGGSNDDDLAFFFFLNVYFFLPLLMLARLQKDEESFFNIITKEGGARYHIDLVLSVIGSIVFGFWIADLMDSHFASLFGEKLGIVVGIALFFGAISMFHKFLTTWYEINTRAISMIFEGNTVEKVGMLVSYTLMITFIVSSIDSYNVANGFQIMIFTSFTVFFFSPLFSQTIFNKISGGGNYNGAERSSSGGSGISMNGDDFSTIYVIGMLIGQNIGQIFIIDFMIDIPKEVFQWMTIGFSIPNMFILTMILIGIGLKERAKNVRATSAVLSIFYGIILYKSGLLDSF